MSSDDPGCVARTRQMQFIQDLMRVSVAKGLHAWLNGGWAIELHLPECRRHHDDLDFAVAVDHLDSFHALLEEHSLAVAKPDDLYLHLRRKYKGCGLSVDTAAVIPNRNVAFLSVPNSPGEWWLRCPADGFSGAPEIPIDGVPTPTVGLSVLLRHKYSSPVRQPKDRSDIAALEEAIGPDEAASARQDARRLYTSEELIP